MIKTVTCIAHKRLKDVASKCVLTAVKASKCICAQGSTPDPLARSPRLPSWIWERDRTGEGRGGKGLRKRSGEGKEGVGGGMEGREGKVKPLPNKNSGYGLGKLS